MQKEVLNIACIIPVYVQFALLYSSSGQAREIVAFTPANNYDFESSLLCSSSLFLR